MLSALPAYGIVRIINGAPAGLRRLNSQQPAFLIHTSHMTKTHNVRQVKDKHFTIEHGLTIAPCEWMET